MKYLRQGQANAQQSAGGGDGFKLDAGDADGMGTMKPVRNKGGTGSIGGQVATLGRGVELTVGRSGTVKATASPTGGTLSSRSGVSYRCYSDTFIHEQKLDQPLVKH